MTDKPANSAPAPDRDAWEKPAYHRIGLDEAEAGIEFGPEILILLS